MHMERISFLRHTVAEHCKLMPKIEDDGFKGEYGMNREAMEHSAVFNLDAYTLHIVGDSDYDYGLRLEEFCEIEARLAHEPKEMDKLLDKISGRYDCGFSGCFGGWYLLLARAHKFLSEDDIHTDRIHTYDLNALALHFGITYHQAGRLFKTLGSGAEKGNLKFQDARNITTEEALEKRIDYLDKLIASNGAYDSDSGFGTGA